MQVYIGKRLRLKIQNNPLLGQILKPRIVAFYHLRHFTQYLINGNPLLQQQVRAHVHAAPTQIPSCAGGFHGGQRGIMKMSGSRGRGYYSSNLVVIIVHLNRAPYKGLPVRAIKILFSQCRCKHHLVPMAKGSGRIPSEEVEVKYLEIIRVYEIDVFFIKRNVPGFYQKVVGL